MSPGGSDRTGRTPARATRFLEEKPCRRCGAVKRAAEFGKIEGGGTQDVCTECVRVAREATLAKKRAHEEAYRQHKLDEARRKKRP